MQIWFIFSLIFSLIVALFAVLNSNVVTIRLLFKNYHLSQSMVILGSAVFGAIIVFFIGIFNNLKLKLKIRELNNTIKILEKNIEQLNTKINKEEAVKVIEEKIE